MKMRAAILCVVLYLELTAAQNQLQVYRGNLIHSRELKQIEVLQDYLLGFDANNRGEVSATACRSICAVQYLSILKVSIYIKHICIQYSMQAKIVHTIVLARQFSAVSRFSPGMPPKIVLRILVLGSAF